MKHRSKVSKLLRFVHWLINVVIAKVRNSNDIDVRLRWRCCLRGTTEHPEKSSWIPKKCIKWPCPKRKVTPKLIFSDRNRPEPLSSCRVTCLRSRWFKISYRKCWTAQHRGIKELMGKPPHPFETLIPWSARKTSHRSSGSNLF
jgi:hypothetical protein